MTRTNAQIWDAFELHKQAIETSALAFDAGHKGEAVRLASEIFILFGRGMRHHKSILDQLELHDRLRFPSSISENSRSGSPLYSAIVMMGSGRLEIELRPLGFGALLNGRQLTFDQWWNETVLSDEKGRTLTRASMVRAMRDQDGGAHFDTALTDETYAAAARGELTGFFVKAPDQEAIPVVGALQACMRQIAEEIRLVLRVVGRGYVMSNYFASYRAEVGSITFAPEC